MVSLEKSAESLPLSAGVEEPESAGAEEPLSAGASVLPLSPPQAARLSTRLRVRSKANTFFISFLPF